METVPECALPYRLLFATDGQLIKKYAKVQGKQVRIEIQSTYSLGEIEKKFITLAKRNWCDPNNVILNVTVESAQSQ
jgi:hypothetical protein